MAQLACEKVLGVVWLLTCVPVMGSKRLGALLMRFVLGGSRSGLVDLSRVTYLLSFNVLWCVGGFCFWRLERRVTKKRLENALVNDAKD